MSKYYYIATNTWGHGRSLEPGNGWTVTAYRDEEIRDKIYDALSYECTGCTIPSRSDITEIMGTADWGICEAMVDEDGGYDVGPCD